MSVVFGPTGSVLVTGVASEVLAVQQISDVSVDLCGLIVLEAFEAVIDRLGGTSPSNFEHVRQCLRHTDDFAFFMCSWRTSNVVLQWGHVTSINHFSKYGGCLLRRRIGADSNHSLYFVVGAIVNKR